MPRFQTVPIVRVKGLSSVSAEKKKTLRKYADFLKKLDADTAGKITLGKQEKYSTVRRHLKEASASIGSPTRVRRQGNVLFVYLTAKKGGRKR